MSDAELKRSIARGVAWVGLASALVAVCDYVAFVVIIRYWVAQEALGTATVVLTLFGALQLAVSAGLPVAAVQRSRTDQAELSTMFWLGLGSGVAAYAIVWCLAPVIGQLYGRPVFGSIFRAFGLMFVIRPLYTIHQAGLLRQQRDGTGTVKLSKVRIVANLVELATKLATAAAGLGLWCFVIGPLARELVYAVGVPWVSGWRPAWICQPRRVAADYRFGLRASGGELLFQIYSNLDYQVVRWWFGDGAVGIYRSAYELVLEPVRFVSSVVTTVAYPAFTNLRGQHAAVVTQFIAFTRQNLIVVVLLLGVILVSAEDLLAMYGPGFVAAAPAARVLACVGLLRALSHLGPPLLDGLNRPDLTLRYHAVAMAALVTAYVVCGSLGETYLSIAIAWAVGYPVAFAVLAYFVTERLALDVPAYLRQLGRIAGLLAIATVAGLAVHVAAGALSAVLRFAASTAVLVGSGLLLLARYDGFSPRAIARSFRRGP